MVERRSDVVVIGAGIAGLTVVENLRARGHSGTIALVGDEPHLPYSRPPLSKQLLIDGWRPEDMLLIGAEGLDKLGVEFLAHVKATALDVESRRVRVGSEWMGFESLVIATGLAPRRPLGIAGSKHIRMLRTLHDGIALSDALRRADRVVILGSGILGCELASASRKLGLHASLVGRRTEIGFRSLGDVVAARARRLLIEHDVELLLGQGVRSASSTALTLTSGARVDAGVIIAAIGSTPATAWLSNSGLEHEHGVLCDHRGMAAPGVYAAGDVARWRDPWTGIARTAECQSAAIEQAEIVAGGILGEPPAPRRDPLFTTELFGNRITAVGEFEASASVVTLAGDLEGNRFVAQYAQAGRPTGLVGWNMPREFRQARSATLTDDSKGKLIA